MSLTIGKVNPMVDTASAISTKTPTTSLRYRADVDGLRAIAVLAVLFYHANIGCTGGFVGVDVFFVISGYLITGLILKDIDGGQFQMRRFWERRIRRILPAFAVVAFSCLIIGWFILLPRDFYDLGKSTVAQAVLAANIYFWRESGYFAKGVEFLPLLHTWSLAVEEQFYLFFPLLLVALNRFSRKFLFPIALLLCGISFCLSIHWNDTMPDANFYLLPTRAWELGIGSLLVIMPTQSALKMWLAETLSWGGLLAIVYAVFFYNSGTPFPGVAALLPVIGAFLIIWANSYSLTFVGKFLALRPIVFVGLISYSLYLWHWPVLVFAKYLLQIDPDPTSLGFRMLLLVVSMILAVLSWKFVETPFRKRSVLNNRLQIFAFAGTTTVVLLLTGLSIYKLNGIPSRVPAAAQQYANGSTDRAFLNELSLNDALSGNFIELGSGNKHQPIDVFVWGDSTAMAAMPAFDSLCKEYSVRGVAATHSSTIPIIDFESTGKYSLKKESIAYNNAIINFIRSNHISNVVLVARWYGYVTADLSGGRPSSVTRIHRGLIETIDVLQRTGANIWIMKQVPQPYITRPPMALAVAVMRHRNPETLGISLDEQRENSQMYNPIFEGLTAMDPHVTVLDPTYLFVNSHNICRLEKDGKSLYVDNIHLTVTGAMELCPLFKPIFDGSPVTLK